MTTDSQRATRRARVRQYRAEGLSTREIARKLGIGQGTVIRDLKAADGAPGAADGAAAERIAARVREGHDAMRHLERAVSQARAARLAQLAVTPEQQRAWARQLDRYADTLFGLCCDLADQLGVDDIEDLE